MPIDPSLVATSNIVAISPTKAHRVNPTSVTRVAGTDRWEYSFNPDRWPELGEWEVVVDSDSFRNPRGTKLGGIVVEVDVSYFYVVEWNSAQEIQELRDRLAALENDVNLRITGIRSDIAGLHDLVFESDRDPGDADSANQNWRIWITRTVVEGTVTAKVWVRVIEDDSAVLLRQLSYPLLPILPPIPTDATATEANGVWTQSNIPGITIKYRKELNTANRIWVEIDDPNREILMWEWQTFEDGVDGAVNSLQGFPSSPSSTLLIPNSQGGIDMVRLNLRWRDTARATTVYRFNTNTPDV